MKLKVKRTHPDSVIPTKAHLSDTGYDLTAVSDGKWNPPYLEYDIGIQVEPFEGHYTEIVPRSSITKYDLMLANSLGIIDQDYRGSLVCRFRIIPPVQYNPNNDKSFEVNAQTGWSPKLYKKGDKIAQLIVRKKEESDIIEVGELSNTQRGQNGFGSTGN